MRPTPRTDALIHLTTAILFLAIVLLALLVSTTP